LSRSLDHLAKRIRRRTSPASASRERGSPAPIPIPADGSLDGPDSADEPIPPSDWSDRRAELEGRVIHQLPSLAGDAKAELWAETAEVAAATGAFADAGVGFANAIWETDEPAEEWFDAWLRAELRLAKIDRRPEELGDALTLSKRRVPPRLVAAFLAWCAAQSSPPPDLGVRLPRLVSLLEDRFDRLAVRIAWLGRLAGAILAGGDSLGLARWRDAAFRRLVEVGPTLDLDAPEFVRFHRRPGGERFQAARDWMARMREPSHRWLARLASPRRLQHFGLDPETEATGGYIDLMFAWGASRLGERNVGRDWEEAAAGVLARPPGAGDAGVHGLLLAAYRHRIRDAQQGRPERPGLPPEVRVAYHQLTDFQRYAVDKLRRASGILEPVDRVSPYRGRDVAGVFGGDSLGLRLRKLFDTTAAEELDREVRALLSAAESDSAPGAVPRIALAAISVAPGLPADTALDALGRAPSAVRLTAEWAWAARETAASPAGGLEEFLGHFLDSAARAAVAFNAPEILRDLSRYLCGPTAPPVAIAQAALGPIAGRFFRALRRSGLSAEAEGLLARLGPAGTSDVAGRVGFAVGWLAVGNEDAATRLLDEAREHLFAVGGDQRARTRLAVAYAAALGFASPGRALGRLEEIIHRFDAIRALGSTNRFFTLPVLELVDAIVRSVVSDDFALGPEVRGWLDDHEFGTRKRISRDMDAVLAATGLAGVHGAARPN
jgi:hypothetical protein